MERLLQIVCSLILLLLLYSLLEMMLPPGSLARFVRLVMGLTLLAAVTVPLGRLPSLIEKAELVPAAAPLQEQGELYAEQGEEIGRQLRDEGRREQESQLAAQISALAELVSGVEEARAEVTLDDGGGLARVVLYIRSPEPERAKEAATKLICGFYSLDAARLECRELI